MYTAVHDFAGRPGSLFAGVYDGHGGRSAVEFVTAHLHTQLERELRSGGAESQPAQALRSAFLKVDPMLMQIGAMHCGTTVAVCLCLRQNGPNSPMANAGDSRVVLVAGGNNPARRLSVDHVATDPAEVQRVVRDGGQVMGNRVGGSLAVTRALGDHCLKDVGVTAEPHYVEHSVGPNDRFLVMASDGVWDVMSDDDAQELVLRHENDTPDDIATAMLNTALSRGTRDNLSCMIIKLK